MYSLQFGSHYHHLSWTSSSSSSSSSTSRAIGLMQTCGIKEARSVITKVLAAQDQKVFKSRSFYADKLFWIQNRFWHKEHVSLQKNQFKVDRLQIILVAKKYTSTCRNCSLVGCLKCVQFHNWFRLVVFFSIKCCLFSFVCCFVFIIILN